MQRRLRVQAGSGGGADREGRGRCEIGLALTCRRCRRRCEVLTKLGEIEESVDAAKQVICRDVRVEVEGIKQSVLIAAVLSHHAAAISVRANPETEKAAARSRVFQQNRSGADCRYDLCSYA